MKEPQLDFLVEVSEILQRPEKRSKKPQNPRRVFNIMGGTFTGPNLKGDVLPGGHYWIRIRPDSVFELDVRSTLLTEDDQVISQCYRGIVLAESETINRLRKGESDIDSSQYYLRTTLVFETTSEKYSWLNQIVTIGIGERTSTGVTYRVYAVL